MKRNIYFHENNSLACSYKRLKGHLSAAYLLSLMLVKGIDKNPSSFLSLSLLVSGTEVMS